MPKTSTLTRAAASLLVLVLFVATTAPSQASAQERGGPPPLSSAFHGVVVAMDDDQPLAGASVQLVELGVGELTHDDGRFHLERVPAGSYTLRVERLGYRTEERPVTVNGEGGEALRIRLEPAALEIDPITVTATIRARATGEALQPVNVVSEGELLRQLEGTLAATIQDEAGIAMTSMGPATAKPVIRGLSGDRVLVLEDGERVADMSASSSDHATASDPLSAKRIEVVRGPAALLYGSNALGGVVNVIRDEVPRTVPDRLTGRATLEASSVDRGLAVGGTGQLGIGSSVALRLEGTRRVAGDLATPADVLENTDRETVDLAGGASWVAGSAGYAGASYRLYRNDYGIPGGFVGGHQNGVRIEMRRHQVKARSEWVEVPGPLSRLELTGSVTDYGHEEIESNGALGTAFDRRTATTEVRAHHGAVGPLASGAAGIRYQWDDHRFGGLLDTEDTRRSTLGLYLLEEMTKGPLTVEAGARYDRGRSTPERRRISSEIGEIREREFEAFSGSFGVLMQVHRGVSLGVNASRAFRIPDVGELFSEGPHLAAYSFEVGNPSLGKEVGTGLDLVARLSGEGGRAEIALFQNRIDGYVFPRNTGRISRVQLPIYQFVGEDARLVGVEGSGEWAVTDHLVTGGTASWIRGTLTKTDEPIPFMPPLKGNVHFRYETPVWFAEGQVRAADEQERVGQFETSTAGYAVADLTGGVRVDLGGRLHTLTLRLTNLTDREYRNHLSRTKEIMPEAGRGVSLLYRVAF